MKIEINKEENFIDVWNEEEQIWNRYFKVSIPVTAEGKKIPEKITINENGTIGFPDGEWTARNIDKAFAMKINSIIDYLQSKGE